VPWDPVQGKPAGKPRDSSGAVQRVFPARHRAGRLWCWGDAHGNLYLAPDGDAATEHIAAHDYGILAITAREQPDGLVIVTGGEDGAVRTWRPGGGHPALPARGHSGLIITQSADDGRALITSLAADGTCPVMDATDGRIITCIRPPADARICRIAALPGPSPAVITLDTHNLASVWQPPGQQPFLTCQLPDHTTVTGI
jgi:WD40 repeat protein